MNLYAFLFGFAEATLFFIVPDVLLCFASRKNLFKGIKASFYTLGGAIIGGLIMYYLGKNNFKLALLLVEKIPGISNELINIVHDEMSESGVVAILLGPLKGIPYKIFAIQAYGLGINIVPFIIISIFARELRFLLSTTLCYYILKGISRWKLGKYQKFWILLTWTIFYIFYFTHI